MKEYLWEYDSEEDQAMWDALDHVEQMQDMQERQKGIHPEIIQRRKDVIANGPFAGNYQGPLYAPHPGIHNDLQTKEDQVAPQSEP